MKWRRQPGQHVGNWLNHPREVELDEVEIHFLQAGEDIGARHNEAGDIQGTLLADAIIAVPRR
jgi:hypothetical protein